MRHAPRALAWMILAFALSGCFVSAGGTVPVGDAARVGVSVGGNPLTGTITPVINAGIGIGISL